MSNINKKGLSSVISTLVIILVAICAISIIALYLNSTITKPFLSPENNCLNSKLNPSLSIKDICYNDKTKDLEIKINRNLNDKSISQIIFTINSNSGTKNWQCSNSCGDCDILDKGSTKTYYLALDSLENQTSISLGENSCLLETKNIETVCK